MTPVERHQVMDEISACVVHRAAEHLSKLGLDPFTEENDTMLSMLTGFYLGMLYAQVKR